MKISKLNIAALGDIHLGHPKTPASHILSNLERAFPDNTETAALDIIFLEGDIFDRLLELPNHVVDAIKLWVARFLRVCAKHDIVVRVLEGTPSHDRGQGKIFPTTLEMMGLEMDLRYVDTLTIEHIERFGIDVLYVPDEWHHDTKDTFLEIMALMGSAGLNKVDYAVMHGQFEYQLPPHIPHPTHDSDRYLEIVRKYIFIGHVHQQSQKQRILAAGSFDRISHGDEGDKGHYRVTVDMLNGDDQIVFVQNKGAMLYRTIDCTGLSIDDALVHLANAVAKFPEKSHVRVLCNRGDDIALSLDVLKERHSHLQWTMKLEKAEAAAHTAMDCLQRETFDGTDISPSNIRKLIDRALEDEQYASIRQRALEKLETVI